MYDRASDSYWSQIAAVAFEGPLKGQSLDEIKVTWTTWTAWARWKERYPQTQVLIERTGYMRNYNRAPYGSWHSLLWQFEALAMLEMGVLVILLSPVNLLVATTLSALLGLNLHGALALRQSAHCTVISRPYLLAGDACCAPSLLLLLGIPELWAFVCLSAWLVPLALTLLLISRCWQRYNGAPAVRLSSNMAAHKK